MVVKQKKNKAPKENTISIKKIEQKDKHRS